jgi:hypothetical protein
MNPAFTHGIIIIRGTDQLGSSIVHIICRHACPPLSSIRITGLKFFEGLRLDPNWNGRKLDDGTKDPCNMYGKRSGHKERRVISSARWPRPPRPPTRSLCLSSQAECIQDRGLAAAVPACDRSRSESVGMVRASVLPSHAKAGQQETDTQPVLDDEFQGGALAPICFQFYIFSTKHLYFWNKTLEMFLEYNFQ